MANDCSKLPISLFYKSMIEGMKRGLFANLAFVKTAKFHAKRNKFQFATVAINQSRLTLTLPQGFICTTIYIYMYVCMYVYVRMHFLFALDFSEGLSLSRNVYTLMERKIHPSRWTIFHRSFISIEKIENYFITYGSIFIRKNYGWRRKGIFLYMIKVI